MSGGQVLKRASSGRRLGVIHIIIPTWTVMGEEIWASTDDCFNDIYLIESELTGRSRTG